MLDLPNRPREAGGWFSCSEGSGMKSDAWNSAVVKSPVLMVGHSVFHSRSPSTPGRQSEAG